MKILIVTRLSLADNRARGITDHVELLTMGHEGKAEHFAGC